MKPEHYELFQRYLATWGGDMGVNTYSRKPRVHLIVGDNRSACRGQVLTFDRVYEPDTDACALCVAKARRGIG